MSSRIKTIYAIQHDVTGRIYVGMTDHLQHRLQGHFDDLKAHRHTNKAMQKDCDEYGFGYTVYTLAEVLPEEWWKERYYMETMRTDDPEIGYNSCDPLFNHTKSRWHFAGGMPKPNKKEGE